MLFGHRVTTPTSSRQLPRSRELPSDSGWLAFRHAAHPGQAAIWPGGSASAALPSRAGPLFFRRTGYSVVENVEMGDSMAYGILCLCVVLGATLFGHCA